MTNNCQVVEIITPKKIILNGLWFGPEHPKKAIIFVHGLGGNAFGAHKLITPLVDQKTAVLIFSNRGHDGISKLRKIDKRKTKGYSSVMAGEALEIFTDCVDDIQGAVNLVKSQNVKGIYLVGHSTGCQKSIYFLSQRGKQSQIKSVILLAPMSDYSSIPQLSASQYRPALKMAQKMLEEKRGLDLLPAAIWPEIISAQRFISLYTPDSPEEIFTYSQANKKTFTLRKVKIPILAILAGHDEFRDRPATKIAKWCEKYIGKRKTNRVVIIKNAPHSFNKYENKILEEIRLWI